MRYMLKGNLLVHEIDINRSDGKSKLQYAGNSLEIEVSELPNDGFLFKQGNRTIRGYAIRRKDEIFLHIAGKSWRFQDVTHEDDSTGRVSGEGENTILAPMPGSVIKLLVSEGDQVKVDQPLVIVEAMKMENEVHSQINGVVKKVLVEPGQQVGFGELLIELAPENGADAERTAP